MKKFIKIHLNQNFISYRTVFFTLPIVLIWRGVWNIADLYLYPDNKVLSYVIGIIIGAAFVVLFKIPNVSTVEES
jgi:Fuseless